MIIAYRQDDLQSSVSRADDAGMEHPAPEALTEISDKKKERKKKKDIEGVCVYICIYIYMYMVVWCVVVVINRLKTKQPMVKH